MREMKLGIAGAETDANAWAPEKDKDFEYQDDPTYILTTPGPDFDPGEEVKERERRHRFHGLDMSNMGGDPA